MSASQFESELCSGLSGQKPTILKLEAPSTLTKSFVLPDCFYELAQPLLEIYLTHTNISGNETYTDPMVRLGTAAPALTYFGMTFGALTDVNGDSFLIDWPKAFGALSHVISYDFSSSSLGSGVALPASLPWNVFQFAAPSCGLSGSIPQTLFSNHNQSTKSLYLYLSGNTLTGSMPSALFPQGLVGQLEVFNVDLSGNAIAGLIIVSPFSMAPSMPRMQVFSFDIGSNKLYGDLKLLIPNSAFVDGVLNNVQIFFENNQFTGSLPNWFEGVCSNVSEFTISGFINQLDGSLPSDLATTGGFSSTLQLFHLLLGNNLFSGDIPSNMFDFSNSAVSPSAWYIDLVNNRLNGTIATDVFAPINWTLSTEAIFRFGSNYLTGDLPATLLKNSAAPRLGTLTLSMTSLPNMNGTIPYTFWESLTTTSPLATKNVTTIIDINISTSKLTGALNLPDLTSNQALDLRINAASCNFTTLNFAGNAAQSISYLDVHLNSLLKGTLPADLFAQESILYYLSAGSTQLSGTFPNLADFPTPKLQTLYLGSTLIDFCSGVRSTWNPPSFFHSCSLSNTTAYYCDYYYPDFCSRSPPPPSWPIPPITNSAPPTAPTPTPMAMPPTGCSVSTRPSTDFSCINGVWTTTTSVTTPTLIVPSGATQTIITGNLTTSTVIIQGLGSTVIVTGCISNLTTITVQLTKTELEKIGTSGKTQSLLRYNASDAACSESLDSVDIVQQISGKTCKEVSVSKVQSEGSLSALFTVNNSKCNTWWIILVSVLCAVVVIGLVAAIVAIKCVQSAKFRKQEATLRKAAM